MKASVGKKIRKQLKKRKIRQKHIAKDLKISEAAVSRFLDGHIVSGALERYFEKLVFGKGKPKCAE